MKFNFTILILFSVLTIGCAQQKKTFNTWTVISLGGTEALVFNGELKVKEQIRYINIDDEVNIERIRTKISRSDKPLWLIIKAADSTVAITSSYESELKKLLQPVEKMTTEPLTTGEKEMLAMLKRDYPNGF